MMPQNAPFFPDTKDIVFARKLGVGTSLEYILEQIKLVLCIRKSMEG